VLIAWEWWAGRDTSARPWPWTWTPAQRRALTLLAALVPVVLWRVYVGLRLHSDFGMEAFFHNPQDLTFPFLGFLELWSINDGAHSLGQSYNIAYPLLLSALLALAIWMFAVRRTAVAAACTVYALIAVSLNVVKIWHWAGNGERGTFESFLMLAVAAFPFTDLPHSLRWALIMFAAATLLYDMQIGTHAEWYRAALTVFG
jgi:hypothetical protein